MENKEKPERQIIRIVSTDVPSDMTVYAGLTKIKGVSWSFSNAICYILKIDKKKKVSSLTPEELARIIDFIKHPKVPEWLLNRRKDLETGENQHLLKENLTLEN